MSEINEVNHFGYPPYCTGCGWGKWGGNHFSIHLPYKGKWGQPGFLNTNGTSAENHFYNPATAFVGVKFDDEEEV
jgi:hypothetical protein